MDSGGKTSPCSSSSEPGRHVKFSADQHVVHIFHMTIGDNPSVLKGSPVQLKWKPAQSYYGVDLLHLSDNSDSGEEKEAEEQEEQKQETAPVTIARRLSRSERLRILKDAGFTFSEIQAAEQQASLDRKARQETIHQIPNEAKQLKREAWRQRWHRKSKQERQTEQQLKEYMKRRQHLKQQPQQKQQLPESTPEQPPSICVNCANFSLDDISTTRRSAFQCQGNCTQVKSTAGEPHDHHHSSVPVCFAVKQSSQTSTTLPENSTTEIEAPQVSNAIAAA
eukprot:CAMPEP_0168730696 /NCGR_PEP_ID=MMETSP0724-20121128/6865_1 /TAXON_ID=265536 /ORGANISM="Amphiprora sp., Strain CCMP467" /LENGTH=278 /DNA_ID=CAMNT_0008777645 /DNA_START=56 /DNA_END=892 /DNA_ORIENTATION=-